MRVAQALEVLRCNTGTLSDITNKAVNQIFTNQLLLQFLQFQLDQYANITKAIEDVYSFPLNTQTPIVEAPPRALRSEGYKFLLYVIQGRFFPMDMASLSNSYVYFPYPSVSGISTWVLPWGTKDKTYFNIFPMNSTNPNSTTLSSGIIATDTTINVVSTNGFLSNNGRITIGSEKIQYQSKTATSFVGCLRGAEGTTAEEHLTASAVTENNVWLFYCRLHRDITITTEDFVPTTILETEIEVTDEHVNGILKAVTYDMMLKLDNEKAQAYKVNADELYLQYRNDIRKGRARVRQGTNIRDPFLYEQGVPSYTNLL